MWIWSIIGLTAIIVAVTKYLIYVFTKCLISHKLLIKNYRGEFIPANTGIIFPFVLLNTFLFMSVFFTIDFDAVVLLLGLKSFFAIFGLLDDLNSDRQKGLFGHIYLFIFKGIVSSGLVKACLGIITSAFFSLAFNRNWDIHILVDTLIIALTANLINLLDVKPGRAAKGVIIWIIIFLIFKAEFETLILLYPITVMIAVFLSGDLQEHFMMGDTGANALGGLLGGITVIFMSFDAKILYLIFLIAVHVLTEFVPLSKIIEKSRILSLVDNLGRN